MIRRLISTIFILILAGLCLWNTWQLQGLSHQIGSIQEEISRLNRHNGHPVDSSKFTNDSSSQNWIGDAGDQLKSAQLSMAKRDYVAAGKELSQSANDISKVTQESSREMHPAVASLESTIKMLQGEANQLVKQATSNKGSPVQ